MPPLFKLLGFQASVHPSTFCCVTLHETVAYSVEYRKITRLQMIFVLIRPPVSFDSINCVSIFQQKFDKLILMKITTRCHILKLKCTKFDFGWGSAPDPTGELSTLHQTPYLDLRGLLLTTGDGRKVGEKGKEGRRRE